ncbi:MAG: GNAT family N-acetyltransferase [Polaromonas sp.]|nr:GNAT family N-acetyltransferase [Gemmatimonadaceae bacterium]
MKSPRFSLVQLAPTHDLERFACGKHPGAAEIDEYLKTSALAEQSAGLSQVWVALDSHDAAVAGYFTLSPLSVPISPEVLAQLGMGTVPYRAVGGYLLGRLGVAVHRQGEGLGGVLVAAAIRTARQAQRDVGGAFVAVDPKNDRLLKWYEALDFGFPRLDPRSSTRRRLILKL